MSKKPKINQWITRHNNHKSTDKYFSVINKITREGRIDNRFVEQLSALSLEEVIALKLEQANRLIAGKLYGTPIYHSIEKIGRDAIVKYALSCSRTFSEAAAFLGIRENQLRYWRNKNEIDEYFGEDNEKGSTSK